MSQKIFKTKIEMHSKFTDLKKMNTKSHPRCKYAV